MTRRPTLAPPVHRAAGGNSPSLTGLQPSCSIGNQIKCVGEAAGVAAACAAVETGVGAAACFAAAAGFVADCHDCEAAQPIKGTICAAAAIGKKLGISVPKSIQSWC